MGLLEAIKGRRSIPKKTTACVTHIAKHRQAPSMVEKVKGGVVGRCLFGYAHCFDRRFWIEESRRDLGNTGREEKHLSKGLS